MRWTGREANGHAEVENSQRVTVELSGGLNGDFRNVQLFYHFLGSKSARLLDPRSTPRGNIAPTLGRPSVGFREKIGGRC